MKKSRIELVKFFAVLPGKPDADTPLPMWNEQKYGQLLKKLEAKRKSSKGKTPKIANQPDDQTAYQEIAHQEGRLLRTLRCAYTNEKFWLNYLYDNVQQNYHKCGWSHFIPLIAKIKPVIGFREMKGTFKVSVIPRIYLFPTGWCVRLSLQIDGPHSLNDLKALTESILERHEKVFVQDPDGSQIPIGLKDVGG